MILKHMMLYEIINTQNVKNVNLTNIYEDIGSYLNTCHPNFSFLNHFSFNILASKYIVFFYFFFILFIFSILFECCIVVTPWKQSESSPVVQHHLIKG